MGLGGSAKGLIVGGKLRATREIACKVMGSPMTTKTFIEVGYNPRMRERLVELEASVAFEKDNFDKVKKGIQTIETLKQRSRGNLPADKEKILGSLREAQEGLKLKLRDLIEELKDLQGQIAHSKAGRVSVEEDVFPGTKIAIRSAVLFVNVKQSKVTFIAERAEVVPRTHITPRPGATVEDDLKQLEEIKAMEAAGEQLV